MVKLVDLVENEHVEREISLIKVRATGSSRDEINRLVEIFRGRIVDVTDTSYTIELTGSCGKIDAFLKAVPNDTIIEVVRSGVLGIARGEKGLRL